MFRFALHFGWGPAQVGELFEDEFWYYAKGFDQMERDAAKR